jgi:uncharacterized RDD family membrane protein YckC
LDLRDKLTIETPEQIALEYHLAGIGSRFLALAFDTLLQFVIYFVLFLALAFLLPDLGQYWASAGIWTLAFFYLIGFVLYWGYFAIFEIIWNGQTPGKRHAGIRVIKDSGRPITAFESLGRNLVRVIDQLPGFYGVGIITMFLNEKNKRLGDFVAGTVVVHEQPQDEVQPVWSAQAQGQALLAAHQLAQLGAGDLELIETFLHRRIDLTVEVRRASAQRIAEHIAQKLQLNGQQPLTHEDFLEKVAAELRSTANFRR